jgi:hypothetical protein
MKTARFAVLTIIALLEVLVLGCRMLAPESILTPSPPTPAPAQLTPTPTSMSPTPTPEDFEPNYTSETTGFSMWYPDDWAHEDFVDSVVFASSEEIIMGTELETGAAMMVMHSELEGSQTIEDLVETTLCDFSFEEVKTSDQKPRTIGGQRGVLVTLEGAPVGADVSMKGFLAGVEHGGWGYLFLAASMLDEWSEHGPVLETMLGSVCFKDTEPVYTNDTLGISMTYPENWIYEEGGEQVIFATSEEIISGAEFETGAAMVLIGSPLEDMLSVEEMVEMMLSELPFEDMELSDVKPRTIGEQRGILVTFQGTPEGEDIALRGFLAATELKGRGYLFFAVSALDEWCDYEPVLETMLDSVQFTK